MRTMRMDTYHPSVHRYIDENNIRDHFRLFYTRPRNRLQLGIFGLLKCHH